MFCKAGCTDRKCFLDPSENFCAAFGYFTYHYSITKTLVKERSITWLQARSLLIPKLIAWEVRWQRPITHSVLNQNGGSVQRFRLNSYLFPTICPPSLSILHNIYGITAHVSTHLQRASHINFEGRILWLQPTDANIANPLSTSLSTLSLDIDAVLALIYIARIV